MRKSLLVSAALAGLGVAAVSQGAAAAPFALAGSSLTVSADDGLFEQIYTIKVGIFPTGITVGITRTPFIHMGNRIIID